MNFPRRKLPAKLLAGITPKQLLLMKMAAIILLSASLQVSARTYSQRLNLSLKDASIEKTFKEIRRQTGYNFFYNKSWINQKVKINFKASNLEMKDALDLLLSDLNLSYSIINSTIVLKKKPETKTEDPTTVDYIDFRGTIQDENGQAMEGVSVTVKGTTRGTSSDANGSFTIAVEAGEILEFSRVGYKTFTYQYNGDNASIRISLEPEAEISKEVVVVGYGTQRRANITGAVSAITAKDLENRPITTTTSALQGQMPGVTIVNGSGKPGGNNSTIRIRGVGTLNNPNPLVLIDGLEGNMDYLNPADIESVSVLKDAASASIYGSRGANGVILVTTKKGSGRTLQPQIQVQSYVGWQQPTRMQKYLGSKEYMQMQNEALTNVGRPASFTEEQIAKAGNGSDPDFYSNTNWLDEVFRSSAVQQNHNVSVSGGSEKNSYYLSYGYLDQQGLIIGDVTGAKRHNVRLRLTSQVLNNVDLDANLGYVKRSQTDPAIGLTGNTGLIYTAHEMTPLVPVRFANGGWGYGGVVYNPVSLARAGGRNLLDAYDITANFSATVRILKGLKLKTMYGINFSDAENNILTRKISYFSPLTGNLFTSNVANNKVEGQNYRNNYQNISAQLDYSKQIDRHSFNILIGASQEWNKNSLFTASREALLNEALPVLSMGTGNQLVSGFAGHWAIRSQFTRLNYQFDDKYLLEFNMRRDGSSRFSKQKRFGVFPSISAGWRITNERFASFLTHIFSDLKLRASWGKLGNDKLLAISQTNSNGSLYPYMGTFNSGRSMPLNISAVQTDGFQQNVLGNPFVTWEEVTVQNIGVDATMLKGRLNITADYFIKKTDGILLKVLLPDVLGMAEPDQNAGAVENKGWELGLSWRDKIGQVFYGISGNLSDVKNKVVSLGGTGPALGDQVRFLGHPIDAFYGLVADRIAQVSDFDFDPATNKYTPKFPVLASDAANVRPGDLIYRDLDNDKAITLDKDRKVIGNPFPRYTYSFRGDMRYKQFDFSFFFQGVAKANGYITGNGRHAFYNEASFPQEMHRDRWTPENTNAGYPRFTYLQNHNRYLSTFWLENAAYLRLKNIQVGYTLPIPTRWQKHFQKIRIYWSGDNMFTKTKFLDAYDPETPVGDGGLYPQLKTNIIGLNISLK
jgi:TonB-linked SusC/RagA family outer membrane protein